jgi:signal transduction histidine kinase
MKRSSSIGRKLRRLSILSSGTAVLAVSLALLFFQLQGVRRDLLRRLETVADLIAFNSAVAVDFNDADAATAMLSSLKMRTSIVTAAIVVNGRVFAMYRQAHASLPTSDDLLHTTSGYRFTNHDVTVFRPIVAEGRPLGMLLIRSDLHEIDQTWRWFAAITAFVAIPALLIAVLISQLSQRSISRPILNLASLAEAVSEKKDYSVRAPAVRSAAEIEQLIDTFNQMLTEIQRQHAEIEEARATLEHRVAERTRELEMRTEQLEVQERELAAANNELEAFSYSVSHDLRAPLRAIDGFSQAILAGGYNERVLDQRGTHFLERVRAGTQKMSSLIDDMLLLARVTRRPLDRTDVDVTAVAEEVAAELARHNPDRHVRCVIEHGLRAWADSHLLAIVFENLLGNAWKFTGNRDEAHIEVGQLTDSSEPVFFVRDNGAGFDMTYAAKLFGPFQRLHDESSFEGTGIGLATVKRIITRHHGLVWAEAVEGEGATFYFTLGGRS